MRHIPYPEGMKILLIALTLLASSVTQASSKCVFWTNFGDLTEKYGLTDEAFSVVKPSDALEMPEVAQRQFMAAVDAGSLEDAFVATDEELFYRADYVTSRGRSYRIVYSYSGDTMVGAIFAQGTVRKVALIGDGDICFLAR